MGRGKSGEGSTNEIERIQNGYKKNKDLVKLQVLMGTVLGHSSHATPTGIPTVSKYCRNAQKQLRQE